MKKLLCLFLIFGVSTAIYAQKVLEYSKGFIVAKGYEESTLVDSMPMG